MATRWRVSYLALLLLAPGSGLPARAAERVLATVGGTQISAGEAEALARKLPGQPPAQVLELLITRELLRLEGTRQGLGANAQVRAELAQFENRELLRLVEEREMAAGRFTEAQRQRGQTLRSSLAPALRDSLGFVWESEIARGLIGREHARPTATDSATTVARWQGGALSVAEYLRRSLIYGVRNSLADTAAARRAGEQQTIDDLLLALARRRGYDREPAQLHALRAKEAELYGQLLFARHLAAGGSPSDSLRRAYFAEHPEQFVQPPGVRVQEILVDDADRADSLRSAILGGADMAGLAAVHSRRKGARAAGGDLGQLHAGSAGFGDLLPQMLAAEVGQLQGPVRQGGLYSLFRVNERVAARPATFGEASAEVVRRLQERAIERYLAQLRERYRAQIQLHAGASGE